MKRGLVHLGSGVPADARAQQHLGGGVMTVLGSEMERRRAQLEEKEEREGTRYVKEQLEVMRFVTWFLLSLSRENSLHMKPLHPPTPSFVFTQLHTVTSEPC